MISSKYILDVTAIIDICGLPLISKTGNKKNGTRLLLTKSSIIYTVGQDTDTIRNYTTLIRSTIANY